jgi:DNA-binding response OmpR family regulator
MRLSMKSKILLVDDSVQIANLVVPFLKKSGYAVEHVTDADDAVSWLKTERTDLLLLDVDLPGISGIKLLEILKKDAKTASIPVIMITVRGEESAKISGLRTGADDYLVKPFSNPELLARVEALLRRVQHSGQVHSVLETGGIRMDMERREVFTDGKRVTMTAGEFDLLALLMSRKGHVLTYQIIGDSLGTPDRTSNNLSVHIKNIRAKLGGAGKLIETVYSVGYRFLDQ